MTTPNDELYKTAVEKLNLAKSGSNVEFTDTEVMLLLDVEKNELVSVGGNGIYTRQDITNMISRLYIANPEGRSVTDMKIGELESLMRDFTLGRRGPDGEFLGFYKISELASKHKVSAKSLSSYAINQDWHTKACVASLELSQMQGKLAKAEVAEIAPRIGLKTFRFVEKVLDNAENLFNRSDIQEQKALVTMVRDSLSMIRQDKSITNEMIKETNEKIDSIADRIAANLEQNMVQDAEVIATTPRNLPLPEDDQSQ